MIGGWYCVVTSPVGKGTVMRAPRFSIAGLMGVVLVASLGLAALRYASPTLAGVVFMLTCSVLALAVVGVACRGQAERAWWLGFALFGWGYLILAFWSSYSLPALPTMTLVEALRSTLGAAPSAKGVGPMSGGGGFGGGGFGGGGGLGGSGIEYASYAQIGHCFWSLLAATLGAMVARVFFSAPMSRSESARTDSLQVGATPRSWWRRPLAIGLACLVLVSFLAVVGLRSARGLWLGAGAILLLTWGLLGLTALGAICGRGRRRAVCLGATLFGVGYLILIFGLYPDRLTWPYLATDYFLNSLRPRFPRFVTVEFPANSGGNADATARVLKALEQPVPVQFPVETPLDDVLKYIQAATKGPDGVTIPIYVDPVGLQEAEKTIQSTVAINVAGVPLKTPLRLLLAQLGMVYYVRDGLLIITSGSSELESSSLIVDPFLLVGHCLLALLAAGLGSVAGLLVYDPARGKPTERTTS
jgi:hypothetical protein